MSLLLIVVLVVVLVTGALITASFIYSDDMISGGLDSVAAGMMSLLWPAYVMLALLVAPFWLIGRAGQWLYEKRNAR